MKQSLLVLGIVLLVFPSLVSAATLEGSTYEWLTLEPLENVVVAVNTTPPQVFVAKGGQYSFELPAGTYFLKAQLSESNCSITSGIQEH